MTEITDFTSAYLDQTRQLAAATEARRDALEQWLTVPVTADWDAFLTHTRSRIGVECSQTHKPSNSRVYGYDLSLTAEGAYFSGEVSYLGEVEDESYLIPWDFIDAATRPAAEARIEADFAAQKEHEEKAAQKQAEHQATQQRKRDEAELERLAAALGKTVS